MDNKIFIDVAEQCESLSASEIQLEHHNHDTIKEVLKQAARLLRMGKRYSDMTDKLISMTDALVVDANTLIKQRDHALSLVEQLSSDDDLTTIQ